MSTFRNRPGALINYLLLVTYTSIVHFTHSDEYNKLYGFFSRILQGQLWNSCQAPSFLGMNEHPLDKLGQRFFVT